MEEFRGDPEQIETLRAELVVLYGKGYKSGRLEKFAEKEFAYLRAPRKDWMSRQDIDKFRENEVELPGGRRLEVLWNVVYSGRYPLPSAKKPQQTSVEPHDRPHAFFHESSAFFNANSTLRTDIAGRFAFYGFSEIFHKFSPEIPRAVVVGQWDIALNNGAVSIEEKQDYDGHLGKQKRKDVYTGYGLTKGRNLCFLLGEAKVKTPKFYILEAEYDDPDTFQVHILSGHMLKGSRTRKYFHSPVYAVRVDGPVERNILRCEDVPPDIMRELDALARRYSHL